MSPVCIVNFVELSQELENIQRSNIYVVQYEQQILQDYRKLVLITFHLPFVLYWIISGQQPSIVQ